MVRHGVDFRADVWALGVVLFLVLPVTVLFAIYPGLVVLDLSL